MRRPIPFFIAGALTTTAFATTLPPTLAMARGRERVLIIFAPSASDPQMAKQDSLFAPAHAGLEERDLRVVHVTGAAAMNIGEAAAALRKRFGVASSAFAVRLIGKDGTVAIARATPIPVADLFATIDAMPMRRDEMRNR